MVSEALVPHPRQIVIRWRVTAEADLDEVVSGDVPLFDEPSHRRAVTEIVPHVEAGGVPVRVEVNDSDQQKDESPFVRACFWAFRHVGTSASKRISSPLLDRTDRRIESGRLRTSMAVFPRSHPRLPRPRASTIVRTNRTGVTTFGIGEPVRVRRRLPGLERCVGGTGPSRGPDPAATVHSRYRRRPQGDPYAAIAQRRSPGSGNRASRQLERAQIGNPPVVVGSRG
jgi:hypothetical protein